jgi:hypothetical protein
LTSNTARNTEPRNASAQVAIGGGAVGLAWQPYSVTPLAGYAIDRRQLPNPASQRIATTGMVDSYIDAGLPAAQYEYSLRTRDTAGKEHQPVVLPVLDVPCYDFDVAPAACDGQVDVQDILAVALAWQSRPGDPGYDPRFDVDGDQLVTIADVQRFAAESGWPQ